jgi:hypothetical protein
MLDRVGVEIEVFGDSKGAVSDLGR